MSDDYNINYSFQIGAAPTAPIRQKDPELIAFTNCATVDLGNGSVLVMNRDNEKQLALAPEVVTALTYCTTFKTLEQHARTLVDTIPQLQGQPSDVTQVLTTVRDAGLMLTAQTVVGRLRPQEDPAQALASTRVFILTCDRPQAVARLLDSMLQAGNLGRHDELFLVDDSRDTQNAAQNRELVANFNRSSAKEMRYAGADAQRDLLDRLVAALPEHEAAIRFLIDRERWRDYQSYGLGRTLCLLLSVGYRCIVLDDDVLCRSVLPPSRDPGISFSGGSGRELACFTDAQELMRQATDAPHDPLAGHARCLGMGLAQAIDELDSNGIDQGLLENSNASMLNTLRADSPILVTQCGSWGDPGMPGSNWFTQLDSASLQRILDSTGGLEAAMQNRHYWLGRTRPNISKMAVMSQATGLDNSRLLPPYFPVFRGEDYLFASMLLHTHPDAAVLDYAWSVPHLPLEQRSGGNPGTPAVSRGGLGLCARYIADRVDYDMRVSPATRLQHLAGLLQSIGECDSSTLLATFREELVRERAAELQQFSSRLQAASAPGHPQWEAFLRRNHETVSQTLQSPANPLEMPEVPAGLAEAALLRKLGHGIGEFGRALAAWPAIRETASELTQRMLVSGELQP